MMQMSMPEALLTIAGLTLMSVVTRSFFFFSRREPQLPERMKRALRYAPLAALAAVVVPEVVMRQGVPLHTWMDARLYATALAVAYYFWRRELLGTIVSGMAMLLALRLGLGW